MRRTRRALLVVAILMAAIAGILLLNFTAPNPTGRRYSSEVVDTDAGSQEKGLQGEQILAHDLGVPLTNDRTSAAVCICNPRYAPNAPAGECESCVAYSESVTNYRIPDVTTDAYFAESKNRRQLLAMDSRDYAQVAEMAAVAQEIGRPLWIYVRVNTTVEAAYFDLARQTGGDVVYYFAVPGYVDPVDQFAVALLIVSGTVVLVIGIGELAALRSRSVTPPTDDSPPPNRTMKRSSRSVQDTEDFMQRMDRLTRKEKDE